MTSAAAERLADDARCLFRESEPPASFAWIAELSPVNLRLFVVELADLLRDSALSDGVPDLNRFIDEWKATANLDASPDVLAEVRGQKSLKPIDAFLND